VRYAAHFTGTEGEKRADESGKRARAAGRQRDGRIRRRGEEK
jgi:hypothetical protein